MSTPPITADASSPARDKLFLLYHEVCPKDGPYSYAIARDIFAQHVEALSRVRRQAPSSFWPEITFDDGHISNHDVAAPILQSQGITAFFFITAGWTTARANFMGWKELGALRDAGHTIGAHGWSHALLTRCSDRELKDELLRPRLLLEDKLGIAVTTMSLPGGRQNDRVLAACRAAGYRTVYTSVPRTEKLPLGDTVGRFNVLGSMQAEDLVSTLDPAAKVFRSIQRRQRMKIFAQWLMGDRLYGKVWSVVNREPEDPA